MSKDKHGCLDRCKYWDGKECDHPRFAGLFNQLELPIPDCPCFGRPIGRPRTPPELLIQTPSAIRVRKYMKIGEYRES
jgi:hypothetical protein